MDRGHPVTPEQVTAPSPASAHRNSDGGRPGKSTTGLPGLRGRSRHRRPPAAAGSSIDPALASAGVREYPYNA